MSFNEHCTSTEPLNCRSAEPSVLASMREDVRCVAERDPAARSHFEVMTIYPGVQAALPTGSGTRW